MRKNKNQNIITNTNHELRQFFGLPYTDITSDDETEETEETDDKKLDITDIHDLEGKKSAGQR